MAKAVLTRISISKSLLDAKEVAAAQFLSREAPAGAIVAFAAHSNPKHNVVGVGVGHKRVKGKPTPQECVRFYVERKIPEGAIPEQFMLPKAVKGVPTDVIETGAFRRYDDGTRERARVRPARPGCSVGFAFTGDQAGNVMAGTFGALVKDEDKKLCILSNNHVLANENRLPIGSNIFQPGLLDNNDPDDDAIAKLRKFITLKAEEANQVDCAIAEVLAEKLVRATVMPKVGRLSSGDPVPAAVGMKVEKTGRTTGYREGVIQDVSANVKVNYEIGTLTFADQIIIVGANQSFSDAGDSGSLIVDQSSKQPVGLLFAGSPSHTIANHIGDVIEQLGVTIVA